MTPTEHLAKVDRAKWKESPRHGSNDLIRWIPLVTLYENEMDLGISDIGTWVIGGSTVYEFTCSEKPVFFLPCLEKGYTELIRDLRKRCEEIGISPGIIGGFPFLPILKTAIQNVSTYWLPRVDRWLGEIPLSDELAEALNNLDLEGRFVSSSRISRFIRDWRSRIGMDPAD
jgi:hypothetical protein